MRKKEVENHHTRGKNQAELEFVLFVTATLSFFLSCSSAGHINARLTNLFYNRECLLYQFAIKKNVSCFELK